MVHNMKFLEWSIIGKFWKGPKHGNSGILWNFNEFQKHHIKIQKEQQNLAVSMKPAQIKPTTET